MEKTRLRRKDPEVDRILVLVPVPATGRGDPDGLGPRVRQAVQVLPGLEVGARRASLYPNGSLAPRRERTKGGAGVHPAPRVAGPGLGHDLGEVREEERVPREDVLEDQDLHPPPPAPEVDLDLAARVGQGVERVN